MVFIMITYLTVEESLIHFKKKVWIIDKNVYNLNFDRINSIKVDDLFYTVESLEENKTFDTYNKILDFLFENNIDRSHNLIALGGGIIGDMTAFVASTFKRGMNLIQVPTTLLSMVDSSIGGKTGINNKYGKNMVGTFYQAKNIIIDKSWLNTLPEEHMINGMAEIIKMALLKGGKLYDYVNISNPDRWDYLEEMIRMSANYKLDIISDDIKETNSKRELLNLGHTFGHAHELSNEILHGFAVSYGTIDELYYTNYYYGYPSINIIENIKKLFIKWKLVDKSSSINYNKMFYYYLQNDKKSNRLITIKDVGVPSIVEFDIEKIKLLKAKYYKLRNFYNCKDVFYETPELVVDLPSSKSETNRCILIASFMSYFSNKNIKITNVLDSKDTNLMINSLDQHLTRDKNKLTLEVKPVPFVPKNYYYLGNSGTCVRFLLPILAFTCNDEIFFDCSEEMKERPIEPLVKSLLDIGCNIEYKENENYLPLIIKPAKQILYNVDIDGTLSSQYVTGLLIGFCYLYLLNKKEYTINLVGEMTSFGFIEMTIEILNNFGFNITKPGIEKSIKINKWNNSCESIYNIESDLSSASYIIAWSYINKFNLILNNTKQNSTQPDLKILNKMSRYFGEVEYSNNCMIFKPFNEIDIEKEITIDLDSSDTFLTWSILFVIEKIQRKKNFISKIKIVNIENQDWKECKRITGLINNLRKLDINLERTKTGFNIPEFISYDDITTTNVIMETFNDHRMAMSFSLIAMINKDICIENPLCVDKTFPTYWKLLETIGVGIVPIDKFIDRKSVILIGMPGCGKTTLGKLLEEKLGFDLIDLDKIISNEFNTSIPEIIEKYGWKKFRDIESTKLCNLLENKENKLRSYRCISTGGGIVENNISRNLIDNGIIIWIRRSLDKLEVGNRKLPGTIEKLYENRKSYYENLSDYIFDNDGNKDDFIKWFKVVFNNHPFPSNSTFLCKTNDEYEDNISNAIELRGDLMDNLGLDKIQSTIMKFNRPIIYTIRSEKEFGKYKLNTLNSKQIYEKAIFDAIKLGSRVIDIEINQNMENEKFFRKIFQNKNNVQILSSVHEKDDFSEIKKNIIFKVPKFDFLKFVIPENCLDKILKLKKTSFSEHDFGKRAFFSEKNFVQNEISESEFSKNGDPEFLNDENLKLEKSSFSEHDFGKRAFFLEKNFVQNEISESEFSKNDDPEFLNDKNLKLEKSSFPEHYFGKSPFFENEIFLENKKSSLDLKSNIQKPGFLKYKNLKLEKCSFSKLDFGIWLNFENEKYRLRNNFLTPIRSLRSSGTFKNQLDLFQYLKNKYLHNSNSKFIFLFGSDIGHSPSAYIHNYVLKINYKEEIYFNLETDNIKIINDIMNEEYFYGASITMPFKENITYKNKCLESTNTIFKNKNNIDEINTDILALKSALKSLENYDQNEIYIFGTGGAAIGAIQASKEYKINSKITIIGRNIDKINEIKNKFSDIKYLLLSDEIYIKSENCIIINCLPPNVTINKYFNYNVNYIDMTYGIHNFKNKLNYKNYISGYEILYIQAAYQYIFWYSIDRNEHNEIINNYREAMASYLNDRFLINTKIF